MDMPGVKVTPAGDPGVELERQPASSRVQVSAILAKNAKIHMRTNACPCCTCCPFVIFSACCLHVAFPVGFILILTVVPYVVVKITNSPADAEAYLQVQQVKPIVHKPWLGYDTNSNGTYSLSSAFPGLYVPAGNSSGPGTRPLLDTLFLPQTMLPRGFGFKAGQPTQVPFQFSCYCKTLGIVGNDNTVSAFTAFLDQEYATWQAQNRTAGGFPNRRLQEEKAAGTASKAAGSSGSWRDQALPVLENLATFFEKAAGPAGSGKGRRLQTRPNMAWDQMGQTWVECNVAGQAFTRPIWRRFSSEQDLVKFTQGPNYGTYEATRSASSATDRMCGAVIFNNDPIQDATPDVKIRMNVSASETMGYAVANDLTSSNTVLGNVDKIAPFQWYYNSGFLALQHLVQKFVIQGRAPAAAGTTDLISGEPHFVPLPVSASTSWQFGGLFAGLLSFPLTLTLQFSPIVASLAYYLARERESRQRELMRMMGLGDSALVWSWVLLFAILNILLSLGCMILVQAFLIKNSDWFLLWVGFFLFSCATSVFGMTVAAFVTTDKMAALGAILFFFASAWIVVGLQDFSPTGLKWLLSLSPATAFIQFIKVHFALESQVASGSTFGTSWVPLFNFTTGAGLFMLFLDFWLWLGIYFYADQIVPWHGVGVPRKPWFCCLKSYWNEICGVPPSVEEPDADTDETVDSELVEKDTDPRLLQLLQENRCVTIRGLRKTFTNAEGQKVNAVQDLSITMYEGECFCLLGHNGAGKTTTMLMLTGCLPQTAGKIKVKGCDIPEQVRVIRSSMGFCPQHNILWDELTVQEHIVFFGRLGGMSYAELSARGDELLFAVALFDKKFARVNSLSGGMKRKLSAALAFLAKPYLVILDEPSSGMDPFARRGMWETLKSWRAGHILCLTTHYMDEADALGDRIAIMSAGKLACCGSSTFLKAKFGCGYVIALVKTKDEADDNDGILHEIQSVCGPSAAIMSAIGKEILVQVPFDAAEHFPVLFPKLDANMAKLGIESYGISVTNLEEVFLKVAHSEKGHDPNQQEAAIKVIEDVDTTPPQATFALQLKALSMRRIKFAARNRTMLCCNILLPPLCLLVTVFLLTLAIVTSLPALVMDAAKLNLQVQPASSRFPITVATGDSNSTGPWATAVNQAWASVPGNPSPTVRKTIGLTTLPGLSGPFLGLAQEKAFVDMCMANAKTTAASQYGAVLYPSAASWSRVPPGVTIWANMSSCHASAIVFNTHANAVAAGRNANLGSGIKITNHPLELTDWEVGRKQLLQGVISAVMVMAAFAFVPAGICSFVVLEKERDVKHQLVISGCGLPAYWLSNYIFDVLTGLIPVAGAFAVFGGYKLDALTSAPGGQGAIVLLFLYLPAVASFSYVFSWLFSKAGNALVFSWIFNLAAGFLCTILVSILVGTESTQTFGQVLRWIFQLFPIYALGLGYLRLATVSSIAQTRGVGAFSGMMTGGMWCADLAAGQKRNTETQCVWLVGDQMLFLIFDIIFWSAIAVGGDILFTMPAFKRFINGLTGRNEAPPPSACDLEDSMVVAEKERVKGLEPSTQLVLVNAVRKVYSTSRGAVHAVRGISFAADVGQVFGLLGVNGAGKTTTFKMLCGQIEPSAGDVYIKGLNVATSVHKVRKLIGYCPQFDALLDNLTTEEHLYLFGRLKGLDGYSLVQAVESQLAELDLKDFRLSRASQLSGGNKRKLSVGMATIAEPAMVFLDEPSAGMDPVARRFMWRVVENIAERRKKSVVILTTHSMEEAEALCSRIAIQVDGQFRCLGTAQQIKSRYGNGLELNVKLTPPSTEEIEKWCTTCGSVPQEQLDLQTIVNRMVAGIGVETVQRLAARPGFPLNGGRPVLPVSMVAEWCIVEARVLKLEDFMTGELVAASGAANVLAVLEKSGTMIRYQIMPEALKGKYSSLGALFSLLQDHKQESGVQDFQVSQTSLEQIFNRFASTQSGQVAMADARNAEQESKLPEGADRKDFAADVPQEAAVTLLAPTKVTQLQPAVIGSPLHAEEGPGRE